MREAQYLIPRNYEVKMCSSWKVAMQEDNLKVKRDPFHEVAMIKLEVWEGRMQCLISQKKVMSKKNDLEPITRFKSEDGLHDITKRSKLEMQRRKGAMQL